MTARSLAFLVPGDLRAATGGYGYDRRIIAGLRQLGWQVTVCALDDSFPFPTPGALEGAEAVFARVPDGGLVMVDGLALGAMPDVAARHGDRVRLVALVHHPLAAETGLSRELAQRLEQSERASLRAARHVFVTSESTAAALAAYHVERPRITIVVPGTDEAPLAHPPGSDLLIAQESRRALTGDGVSTREGATAQEATTAQEGVTAREGAIAREGAVAREGVTTRVRAMHLLCVATITPRKGHDVLIDALASLASLPWILTCVGSLTRSADTVAALRNQISRAGLDERVALVGELTGDALESAYQRTDLFVLPTRYEGYGMVIAEALARGLPVISTRTGAIPDLVGANAGLLVTPGDTAAFHDALSRVLRDPALLASLREGARAARYTLPRWPQSCAKMSQVLEQVMRS